ncbi:MAG: hypothetical protein NTU89_01380 [Candidatus Dependentiae bacterium]|nr:hypothetical protein [Candidatus Dependentiae bacterium]
MKKLLLSAALLSSFTVHAGPWTMYKNVSDWLGCQVHGYIEISPIYYPKTIKFLHELQVKYPVELNDVEMSIGFNSTFFHKSMGLSLYSSLNTIYFPVEWICAIEKDDEYFTLLTEWATLREAGRMCIGEIIASRLIPVYWFFFVEASADHYATTRCQNPKAIIAAYEHIDRFSPRGFVPSILGRFAGIRLSNMKKTFVKKFGYELEVAKRQA